MTLDERKKAANAELKDVGKWLVAENRRIYAKLNEELGTERKFSDSNELYEEMYKEMARRCLAIQAKYDLPPDTKLKLW